MDQDTQEKSEVVDLDKARKITPDGCSHEFIEEPDGEFMSRTCKKCGWGHLLRK